MSEFTLTIDGHPAPAAPGQTVLDAARRVGLEIPTLCYLQKCGPLNSCQVCLVKINGRLVPACGTPAQPGMVVESETDEVHAARRTALELLFSDHVGDCLSPCQRLCPLRMNIPVMIRQLQTRDLAAAISTVREALPLPAVLGRLCHHPCEQGCRRGSADEPAGIRSMERSVADWDLQRTPEERKRSLPTPAAPSGKSVVIVGAGPAGLAAAHYLVRLGHACTVADRNPAAGGTLRSRTTEQDLPPGALDGEIAVLRASGVQFRFDSALGRDLTVEGLLRGFDAVLLAVGETSKSEGEDLGLEMAPGGIKVDPDTFQTNHRAVFAAGRAIRPLNQVLRAMTDGQAAAGMIHLYLREQTLRKPSKPFSSIMGRLDKDELKVFLDTSNPVSGRPPCEVATGFTPAEAASEAMRCLRCDCRSSGDCALQSYAEAYGADASRFRSQRRKFEQYLQPGGVIFEPGKCILCGICVQLTELAREPLGLAFIGRGFDVRIGTPFNRSLEDGLQTVAGECVRACPTGALTFKDGMAPG